MKLLFRSDRTTISKKKKTKDFALYHYWWPILNGRFKWWSIVKIKNEVKKKSAWNCWSNFHFSSRLNLIRSNTLIAYLIYLVCSSPSSFSLSLAFTLDLKSVLCMLFCKYSNFHFKLNSFPFLNDFNVYFGMYETSNLDDNLTDIHITFTSHWLKSLRFLNDNNKM